MNKFTFVFLSALLTPLLASAAQIQLSPAQMDNIQLSTAKVSKREGVLNLQLNGILRADQRKTYRVAPVVEGMVLTLNNVSHNRVTKGQILATISSNSLGQAQADYLESLARFDLAKSERLRIKSLWQEGIVAESRWLKVDSEYKASHATLESGRRLLSLTGLSTTQIKQLEKQTHRLAVFDLISPIDGVITEVDIEVGQLLSAGQAAFHIDDLSSLWAMVNIPVASLSQVNIGVETEIKVASSPNKAYIGILESLSAEVDRQSQTLLGRIVLDNPNGELRPGMYAEVNMTNITGESVMVPVESLFRIGDQNYVLKLLAPGNFESVAVEIGLNTGKWVAVSGIEENAMIVNSGVAELKSHIQYQGGQ